MNPYQKLVKRTGEHDARFSSSLVGRNGEINAGSDKELIGMISSVINAHNQSEMQSKIIAQNPELKIERQKVLVEALNSRDSQEMLLLGEALAAEIQDTTNREGFARRILQYRELGQGEVNQVRIREHNIIAMVASSTTEVTPTIVRNRKLLPPEFNVEAYILIDLKELSTTPADLLEEKYEEGLAAVMVAEDRLWKTMADATATIRNSIQYFSSFTPTVFARIREQVARWGIPVPTFIIASDLWNDIIGQADFSSLFDPVTKWELLQDGFLGTILGCAILTDSFRQPNLRVISTGEVYAVGAPVNHGVMSVRGTMLVEPINTFPQGKSQKGWFINEIASMVLGNPASLCKGQRI